MTNEKQEEDKNKCRQKKNAVPPLHLITQSLRQTLPPEALNESFVARRPGDAWWQGSSVFSWFLSTCMVSKLQGEM